MNAKYRSPSLLDETKAAIEAAMSEHEWRDVETIARTLGRARGGTEKTLRRMMDAGRVERTTVPVKGGGRRFLWRKMPAGYEAPLYETPPGFDIRALASCFGGYTFLAPVKPSGDSRS